jgi:hypothetical protein
MARGKTGALPGEFVCELLGEPLRDRVTGCGIRARDAEVEAADL